MSLASALVSGDEPLPSLAEAAIRRALAKAGETQAEGVLLFLTHDFSGHAQQAVTAAARAARCTQVGGGIAAGVFTEDGWVLDRPAAAVMVFAGDLVPGHREAGAATGEAILSYAGSSFPSAWCETPERRFGSSFAGAPGRAEAVAWQQSRLAEQCCAQLIGGQVDIGVSRGWRLLGDPCPVDSSHAYELLKLGGDSALDNLMRLLPPGHRNRTRLPLASLCAVLMDDSSAEAGIDRQLAFADGAYRPIAIIAANADCSLTLVERTLPGQQLGWAIRSPEVAEEDMRRSIARLATVAPEPAAAVVFSCIGRGPYFYGGEDHDIACLRARFPGLPLIGTYGTGQIAPDPKGGNHLLQNAVVTALISPNPRRADVQSQP